ncbi:alpha/beta fold hydrolase [Spirillospora sp. NPDC052242]
MRRAPSAGKTTSAAGRAGHSARRGDQGTELMPADLRDVAFLPIRRFLVDAGIAVLSYDKRGVGNSSGQWRTATMDDLAADALAALDFLRSQLAVPAEAVGLFGHSEGGWVVLRAAVQDALPWVIINSCPGTTPAVQERYALANTLQADGLASPQHIDRSLALYDRLVEAGRRDAGFAEATRLIAAAGEASDIAAYWADVDEDLGDSSNASRIMVLCRTRCGCAARTWRSSEERTNWCPLPTAFGCSVPWPVIATVLRGRH